jgi:hypothetical protein
MTAAILQLSPVRGTSNVANITLSSPALLQLDPVGVTAACEIEVLRTELAIANARIDWLVSRARERSLADALDDETTRLWSEEDDYLGSVN